jgi:XTP/dITP diphosphohydrolase
MSRSPTLPRRIVLATRNPHKLREMRQTLGELGFEIAGLADVDPQGAIPEPEETGTSFAQNARQKAGYYACATGLWALADDSGLEVDALGGAPGVYSARYAAQECPAGAGRAAIDAANNRRLLRELKDVGEERRTARFVCHLALADGQQVLRETRGVIQGRIAFVQSGQNGFGYDPLFLLPERGCTMAELSSEAKNAISHRGQAVRQMAALLRQMSGKGDGGSRANKPNHDVQEGHKGRKDKQPE